MCFHLTNNSYLRLRINPQAMKKFLLLCLLLPLACCNAAHAQRILVGKRAPELRIATWLADSKPAPAPLTYIEFYHSSNPSGLASLDRLRELVRHADRRLRVIIVAREAPEAVAERLAPYVSELIGVGFDPSGQNYSAFEVDYVPYGVLTNARNRVMWLGNTLRLTPEDIDRNR